MNAVDPALRTQLKNAEAFQRWDEANRTALSFLGTEESRCDTLQFSIRDGFFVPWSLTYPGRKRRG